MLASAFRAAELRVIAAAGPADTQGIGRHEPSGARSYDVHPELAAVSLALRWSCWPRASAGAAAKLDAINAPATTAVVKELIIRMSGPPFSETRTES
ncbi:hypothetical protein DU475_19150 [Rhodopseudomonas sp. WA056]|uniref:hypothetical protein n=1 Tax=Rhodopseudomonas sp. WA056 TaxID=2269367 RepID=UPI0013DE8CC9|nr:hypothetical protein [Rhodopseudomonas sp. WA056]NEW89365.1 hypothetical protein [Rhodopseudomonas sp. WA056]